MHRLLILIILAGCAHKAETRDEPRATELPPVAEAPTEIASEAPARAPGTVSRAEVDAVLARSPGVLLAEVEPEPRFVSGRFHGWRLTRFFPRDARFSTVDLKAGDVVTKINGRSVEKPEQLMQVWNSLKTAGELTLDVERNGAPRTLRWTIVAP